MKNTMVISYHHNILMWRIAEKPFIFSGEIADIFIPNGSGCAGGIQIICKHPSRLSNKISCSREVWGKSPTAPRFPGIAVQGDCRLTPSFAGHTLNV
jgi:hypothetical protein